MAQSLPSGPGLNGLQRLALSFPTFVFAGYDLARRSYLPLYLSGELKLPITTVAWLVALAGFAAIPAEVVAGSFGDHGRPGWGRRGQWMMLGSLLIVTGACALLLAEPAAPPRNAAWAIAALVTGWALCNVTHGAWALEIEASSEARARIFGLRSLFGIAGGMAFAALALLPAEVFGPPFRGIMAVVVSGAVITHALLIAAVPDRPAIAARWCWTRMVEPLRLLWLDRPNRQLAALFALNGIHTAITAAGYLYLVEFGCGLPAWGPTGVFLQSLSAALGILGALRLGTRWGAARLLRVVLWANLGLALILPTIPPHRPLALLAWSAAFGLFSAVDFMALRVLLGERLDRHRDAGDGTSRAASHYAGFHLPFNLFGAAASGLLFAGYRALGFEPRGTSTPEQVYLATILLPAASAVLVMAASLYVLREHCKTEPDPPAVAD